MTASNPFGDTSAPRPGDRPARRPHEPRGAAGPRPAADPAGDGTVRYPAFIGARSVPGAQTGRPGGRRGDARPALVLVAHGSRDPRALETVLALRERVRALRPGLDVRLGHIELNAPLLTDTLAALGPGPAVLVPLLLGRGYHVKEDIPAMAAAAEGYEIRLAPPLGPHPLLLDALHARLLEAGWPARPSAADRRASGVVLAAAGSRDPDSARDTRRTAARLADRLGVPVLPGYATAAPSVPDAVRALRAQGRHRIAVASYFTAPGRFSAQCAAASPWIAAEPLGAHRALAELVLHRYAYAAATGHRPAERHLATA